MYIHKRYTDAMIQEVQLNMQLCGKREDISTVGHTNCRFCCINELVHLMSLSSTRLRK